MTERTSKMGKRNRFATKFPKLSFKNTFCFVVKNTKLLKRNIDGGQRRRNTAISESRGPRSD